MDPDIEFSFEGAQYTVSAEAYELGRIILPDGRMLKVLSWLETYPPQPRDLQLVAHEFMGMDVVRIANKLEGALAVKQESD